ncbi:MAG: hypothetical protein WDA60_18815, partial [Acidimicrobiia bacterium]
MSFVHGSGGRRIGSPYAPVGGRPRDRRLGWWFWFPFLMGAFFTVGGVAFSVFSVTRVVGIIWLVLGLGFLAVAWYIRRDIREPDPAPVLPGVMDPAVA